MTKLLVIVQFEAKITQLPRQERSNKNVPVESLLHFENNWQEAIGYDLLNADEIYPIMNFCALKKFDFSEKVSISGAGGSSQESNDRMNRVKNLLADKCPEENTALYSAEFTFLATEEQAKALESDERNIAELITEAFWEMPIIANNPKPQAAYHYRFEGMDADDLRAMLPGVEVTSAKLTNDRNAQVPTFFSILKKNRAA